MMRSARLISVLCALSLMLGSMPAASTGSATEGITIADQGWRVVQKDGVRQVEVRALVTNRTRSPMRYQVRFTAEVLERVAEPTVSKAPDKRSGARAQPAWRAVRTMTVEGGPLAPGASEAAVGFFPYELLQTGRAYRFSAQLLDAGTGALLGAVAIASKSSPFLGAGTAAIAAAALVGAAALGSSSGAEPASGGAPSGTGTMAGQHTSLRVNGQWVEQGTGTIDVSGPRGRLILEYSYDAQGPSCDDVSATATATGQLIPLAGDPKPVLITSAAAQLSRPGTRQQAGQVVTRIGGFATGTFSGTVDGAPWSGVLTLSEGEMTLDLGTNQGTHEFHIQFTASG